MTVEQFNGTVKVGDTIVYKNDFGEEVEDVVKYEASELGSGTPVMWIEGMRGCYDLQRFVRKV